MTTGYTLAIHGGAGVLPKARITPELERDYHAALERVLETGEVVLRSGGTALDAVTAAVCALEDEPLFNAGRGAVFTSAGTHEMDAAVMEGTTRRAGAVAGICGPRNPIRLARTVMETTDHVLMIGDGALEVGRAAGLDYEHPDYFYTQDRWNALQATLDMKARGVSDDDPARRHGTVGAVARDREGRLAAATSTGGMTAKMPGRVGDSPVIGAGTFADDATCAVSATGHGEIFLRWVAAHEIDARMRHRGESLEDAARHVVMGDLVREVGDTGGLVAVGRDGSVTLPFNSEGMYRGIAAEGQDLKVAIY
ncbi:beta-aspartyl-peptidase (threonine type) [Tranquillimonas rosea]|uniref:Isoaspartyl peptidase n=1 Tax=Tranquillimonas rosea TaxID=641238 RepID=A0A1H9WJH9_9RHOB|nr:isoaspartyl peptidase/L-asparaginase [Tranquillimonas rosea]SES34048.1 beta-aspartyl-peptidase (threonine type) [Tranquillimonas rosea]